MSVTSVTPSSSFAHLKSISSCKWEMSLHFGKSLLSVLEQNDIMLNGAVEENGRPYVSGFGFLALRNGLLCLVDVVGPWGLG